MEVPALKTEVVHPFETLMSTYKSIWRDNPNNIDVFTAIRISKGTENCCHERRIEKCGIKTVPIFLKEKFTCQIFLVIHKHLVVRMEGNLAKHMSARHQF
jgi:hypothetical protein